MVSFRKRAGLVAIVITSVVACFADTNGKITGTVTDPSRAVVASAAVTAIQLETGVQRTTKTDLRGNFTLLALPPGHYNLEVRQVGFKTYEQKGINVDVNSALQINVSLSVGSLETKVEVESEPLRAETVNTQLGDVIGGRSMESLPLNGRTYTDLLGLQPGVVPVSGCPFCSGSATSYEARAANGNVSINGQREDSNGFMVNGGNVEEARNNGTAAIPNLDSIAEFRVITNTFDAEYGHYSGGMVSVVTKSGTNEFHGSAFEFLRNTDLDARNFYSADRGVFRRNQFGGTFGGPVKHDKLFFFVDYQGTRELQGLSVGRVFVPTTSERIGDFSAVAASALTGSVGGSYWAAVLSGRLGYPVRLGESYYTSGCNSPSQCVFPGGIIPQGAFSSAAKGMLPYIPSANHDGYFLGNNNQNTDDNRGSVRVDAETHWGRFSIYYFKSDSNVLTPFGESNVPGFPSLTTANPQQLNLAYTRAFGSTAINELRFNVLRTAQSAFQPTQGELGTKLSSLGFLENVPGGITPASPAYEAVPFVIFNNFVIGVPPYVYQRFQTSPQLIENFSKTTGSHALKVGGEYHYTAFHQFFPLAAGNGYFDFAGTETGSDVADFLIGAPTFFLQQSVMNYYTMKNYAGFYAQDTWRVRPNLTLNYGLRWDIIQNWYDRLNQSSDTYIPGEQSVVFPGAPKGDVFAGDPRPGGGTIPRTVAPTPLHNLAPRIGIAYSPSANSGLLKWLLGGAGKTSIRAGYGIFYTNNNGAQIYAITGAAPFVAIWFSPVPPQFEAPLTDRSDGVRHPSPFPFTFNPSNTSNFNWASIEPIGGIPGYSIYNRTPSTEDYHFTIQREFGSATLLTVGYAGSQGHHLINALSSNPGDPQLCLSLSQPSEVMPGTPTCGAFGENVTYTRADGTIVNGTRPRMGPLFADNPYYTTIGNSNYNALQVSVRHSSGRLTFLAGYTYSKSIDDTSDTRETEVYPYNFRLSRELSSFDMTHAFVLSYNYRLPFDVLSGKRWQWLVGGWQLSGITHITTGLPITLSEADDRSLLGSTFQPPDTPQYSGEPLHFTNPRSNQPYFNISAFSPETLGNVGARRRFFHGPGIYNFDVALMKPTKITERISLEFRSEFFNVFNHAQFMNPNGNINSSTFGVITSARDPRIGQLSLKVLF